MMKVAIGCDPNAANVKNKLSAALAEAGYDVQDMGSDDPIYANTAFAVAEAVRDGRARRGILICGTGIGMSIAANKVKGVCAALITDPYSAERAQKSNDACVACFGAFTLGYRVIEYLAKIFLASEYDENSPSAPKVRRITEYDGARG